MLKILFKTAIRNIRKDLYQSILNIVGLLLGFAAFLYITTYFFHELSFDKYHSKADQIHRCVTKVKLGETKQILSTSEVPLALAVKSGLPEIEDATRLYFNKDVTVKVDENKYIEDIFWYADENVFQVFDFELLEGDKRTALSKPNSVIVSRDFGEKYFGTTNPIGKSIEINANGDVYQVTGILKDIPASSHLQFKMLASLTSVGFIRNEGSNEWGNFHDLYTYVLLKKNTDLALFNKKFQEFTVAYYIPMMEKIGMSYDDFINKGNYVEHSLQPLSDIHLGNEFTDETIVHGNRQLLSALGIIGLFIIVIACFNFINLSTARASLRAKEIGVKKIIGSSKKSIIIQILTETFLQCCIALLLALLVIFICIPFLNGFSGLNLEFPYFVKGYSLLTMIVIPFLVVSVAGIFPSYVISKFNPVEVIKGRILKWNTNSSLRNALVAFQFVIFIILVCGTIVVKKQVHLLQHKNPGFLKENVLIVKNANKLKNDREVFKNEILKNPQIINASYASSLPSMFDDAFNPYSKPDKKKQVFLNTIYADIDFLETMKIKVIDGRRFSKNGENEKNNVIISEKTARIFGWSECKDKVIYDYSYDGNLYNVIGIVKDFHIESLRTEARPTIIKYADKSKLLALRIQPESVTTVLASVKSSWGKFNNAPFEYAFLDESFDSQYKTEVRFGKLVSLFSIISIVIACLGLLGLVSFTLNKKRKEIGVRKVNGATVSEVMAILNKDLVKWVGLAFFIATPVAWYAMSKWLESFAYKTVLSWWIFVLAGVLALGIALLTVNWQSWRAATRNPVEALRYE